jgi:hypothetical protein
MRYKYIYVINMSDFSDEYDLEDDNVLENIFRRNVLENVDGNGLDNFDISSNNFDNNDHGFDTKFTFSLPNDYDSSNYDAQRLYKNHNVRKNNNGTLDETFSAFPFEVDISYEQNCEPYNAFPYEQNKHVEEDLSDLQNKHVEEETNLSDLNDDNCCFDNNNQKISGKIVQTVKKTTKKKRKVTNVDIKEQPKKKKTRNAPFEAGSNILKLDDCSVYKITNIYAGERAGVWKADVEQVFPEGGLLDKIVIDKDKYVPYNTII